MGPTPCNSWFQSLVPMAPYSWRPGITSYIHGHNKSSLKSHDKMLQCNERYNKSDGSRGSWIYYPRETNLHSENFQSMVDNENGIKCNAKCWWLNGHVDNWQMWFKCTKEIGMQVYTWLWRAIYCVRGRVLEGSPWLGCDAMLTTCGFVGRWLPERARWAWYEIPWSDWPYMALAKIGPFYPVFTPRRQSATRNGVKMG